MDDNSHKLIIKHIISTIRASVDGDVEILGFLNLEVNPNLAHIYVILMRRFLKLARV
jgi:hypothetical protein